MRPLLLPSGEPGKPRAEKSLADHLNGEYMTQICNFYPLPRPCSYPYPLPRPSVHPIPLFSLYANATGALPLSFQFLNFCFGRILFYLKSRGRKCLSISRYFYDMWFSIINSTRLLSRIIELLSAVFGRIEYSLSSVHA